MTPWQWQLAELAARVRLAGSAVGEERLSSGRRQHPRIPSSNVADNAPPKNAVHTDIHVYRRIHMYVLYIHI